MNTIVVEGLKSLFYAALPFNTGRVSDGLTAHPVPIMLLKMLLLSQTTLLTMGTVTGFNSLPGNYSNGSAHSPTGTRGHPPS